jgi:hypothetical protein
VLECWSVGVLECWSVGVLECWSVGVLERWSVGALEGWSVGALERWSELHSAPLLRYSVTPCFIFHPGSRLCRRAATTARES